MCKVAVGITLNYLSDGSLMALRFHSCSTRMCRFALIDRGFWIRRSNAGVEVRRSPVILLIWEH